MRLNDIPQSIGLYGQQEYDSILCRYVMAMGGIRLLHATPTIRCPFREISGATYKRNLFRDKACKYASRRLALGYAKDPKETVLFIGFRTGKAECREKI
jgi:hypothetical protein